MPENTPRIPLGSSERSTSEFIERSFRAYVHPERRPAVRIFIASLVVLTSITLFSWPVILSGLGYGSLMFFIGLCVSGPGVCVAGGVRLARIFLQYAGAGGLMIAGIGAAFLALTGGDASAHASYWGAGPILNLCFATALYCIPISDPHRTREPDRQPIPENPRGEYERLKQQTAANRARIEQLERDNPDFNRP